MDYGHVRRGHVSVVEKEVGSGRRFPGADLVALSALLLFFRSRMLRRGSRGRYRMFGLRTASRLCSVIRCRRWPRRLQTSLSGTPRRRRMIGLGRLLGLLGVIGLLSVIGLWGAIGGLGLARRSRTILRCRRLCRSRLIYLRAIRRGRRLGRRATTHSRAVCWCGCGLVRAGSGRTASRHGSGPAMIRRCEVTPVLRGRALMRSLHRRRRDVMLACGSGLGGGWASRNSARTVKACVASRGVVDHCSIHIGVVHHTRIDVHHRGVIAEVASRPHPADESGAEVAEPVIDASVKANMGTPITWIPDIQTVRESPVTRCPQQTRLWR